MRRYVEFLERVGRHKDKKIIIWGAGISGKQIQKALSLAEIKVAYFVDSRQIEGVFATDKLLEENKSECLVIVSPHHIPYIVKIDEILEKWGWTSNVNFINYVTDDIIQANQEISYFDPLLGFSQIKDIEGFSIHGDVKMAEHKIVVLGNCTSVSRKAADVWVDYFVQNMGVDTVLYNGACAGYSSSQELLKLIRDVLALTPETIIVMNGVIDATEANREANYPYYTRFECNLLNEYFGSENRVEEYNNMQTVPTRVLYGQEDHEENWKQYIRNVRIMHAIADELKIKFFCFFQPSLYCNSYGLTEQEKEVLEDFYIKDGENPIYSTAHQFYKNVCSALNEEIWFYQISEIFKGMRESAYLDEIHYTNEGHRMIAEYVLRTVN